MLPLTHVRPPSVSIFGCQGSTVWLRTRWPAARARMSANIKHRVVYIRWRQLLEAAVLRWRIMIDWLELDLHQTLKCAAGNYFVLERGRERMGGKRERERDVGWCVGGGCCQSGWRAAVSSQWHLVVKSRSKHKKGHMLLFNVWRINKKSNHIHR